jgi:hypothetical protein
MGKLTEGTPFMGNVIKKGINEKQWVYPCRNTERTGLYVERNEVLLENPPQHRAYPANPLKSVTTLGLQYRGVRVFREEHQVHKLTLVCEGAKHEGTRQVWQRPLPLANMFSGEATNWELAIRRKLQEDKVSFAENVGEWREARDTMYAGSNVLKKAASAARNAWRVRKNRRAFIGMLKRAGYVGPWEPRDIMAADLAVKFGIVPIIGQAYDVANRLNKVESLLRRKQVTLRSENELVAPGIHSGEYVIRREASDRVIVYVWYTWNNGAFTRGNLAESLWYGTRLSFMVDWFWDFGGYLNSFNAMEGVREMRGVLCQRKQYIGRDTRVGNEHGQCSKTGTWVYQSYQRGTLGSIPYAGLPGFSLPGAGQLGKMVSATEILFQLRRNRL